MKAVTWQGKRDVRTIEVPDPKIEEPTDAIIKVTSTNICGSDLHLYEVLGAVHGRGRHPRPRADGRRRGGRQRGRATSRSATASSCRSRCRAATASCATSSCTRSARRPRCASTACGAALFGYSKLYGEVPGGQAEYLRVPQAQFTHIKVPRRPGGRAVRLPLRRAAHRVAGRRVRRHPARRHASSCSGSARSATCPPGSRMHQGARVIGVDLVPERLERARQRGRRGHRPQRPRERPRRRDPRG